MTPGQHLKELKEKRRKISDRIYYLIIEIAFIFALPAFGGLWFGMYLDGRFGTKRRYTLIVLLLSFMVSWLLVIARYRRVTRALKEVEDEIKKVRDEV
ncbi:MAG: AtpZ/AtpI family protein [bacterium]|nr:AtpZ/AtpI family protein [bacterium]